MTRRLYRPPEPIAAVARRNNAGWHLVRGEVLGLPPPGAGAIALPHGLDEVLSREPPIALARVDVEELYNFDRPGLATIDYGRDLYLSDGTAGALLRIAGPDDAGPDDGGGGQRGGRLHPDVELHLGAPFVEHALEPPEGALTRTAFVRAVRVGEPLYVFGRGSTEQDLTGLSTEGGYRAAALIATFDAERGPLHLYDEAAFRQLAAWHALPWYRKLSVLVRNR